jgi:hypothetical protein
MKYLRAYFKFWMLIFGTMWWVGVIVFSLGFVEPAWSLPLCIIGVSTFSIFGPIATLWFAYNVKDTRGPSEYFWGKE